MPRFFGQADGIRFKQAVRLELCGVAFISKQPKPQQLRLFKAIYRLPFVGDIKAMKGHTGFYRLRVGDYRVIYTVNNDVLLVQVIEIGNRGDIYK